MCALLGKFFHNLSAAFDVAALIEANFPAIATTMLRFGSEKNGSTSIWLQGQLGISSSSSSPRLFKGNIKVERKSFASSR